MKSKKQTYRKNKKNIKKLTKNKKKIKSKTKNRTKRKTISLKKAIKLLNEYYNDEDNK